MKKRHFLLIGGVVAALLVVGLVGVGVVAAQELGPEVEEDGPPEPGSGFRGGFFPFGGRDMTMFDTAAEVLGLTPEELFAELHDGKNLAEIAEEQGVELEAIREAVQDVREEVLTEAIEQALEEGVISQDEADWLLEGQEKGYLRSPFLRRLGGRRGLGRGPGGRPGFRGPANSPQRDR